MGKFPPMTATPAPTDGAESPPPDAIVIGAGAAGLLAAARAAERGRRTLLLEKNRKAGVKILISGGTRCNLTHHCGERGIIAGFGSAGSFLHSPLAALSPRDLVEMFQEEGVPTYVEPGTDKIFPTSDRALDVVNALLRKLKRSGAELSLGEPVHDVRTHADGFLVTTGRRSIACPRVLITTGGKSYPGCGTTGDAYAWLAALGHTIRPPRPALVPLTSGATWVRELSGIALQDVRVRVVSISQDDLSPDTTPARRRRGGLPPGVLIERRGALLFTHLGLSGPAAMDVSRAVTNRLGRVALQVDFLPQMAAAELDQRLRESAARDGKKLVVNLLPELLPQRLMAALFAQADLPLDRRAAEFSTAERARLATVIKAAAIPISGSRGYEKAEVTAGGVDLDEVDSRTMQSKIVPGLFLAGEILDLDGFIGGYNFQAAFSTGYVAGSNL